MPRDIIKGIRLKNRSGLDATAIAEAIEQGFLNMRRPDKEWTEKVSFAPSTIGYGHGRCARYWNIVFRGLDNYTDTVDSMGVANMSLGSAFHDEIQKAMEAAGLLVEAEREIKLVDPPIRGYLDAVLKWQDEEIVAEIKTTRQESFAFKETSRKPSVNHLIQLLIYLRATGLKRGFILYVNKNDQTFLVLPVEMDEKNTKILDDVLEWLRVVKEAHNVNAMPAIPFTQARNAGHPTNNICRGCPVQKSCFSRLEEEDILIPLMEMPEI